MVQRIVILQILMNVLEVQVFAQTACVLMSLDPTTASATLDLLCHQMEIALVIFFEHYFRQTVYEIQR